MLISILLLIIFVSACQEQNEKIVLCVTTHISYVSVIPSFFFIFRVMYFRMFTL